ncbi:TonB-dependent siderophore receptor [Kerstersia gyiorum]|uniref:TonB-dependent siderophore receptor n=1 Tax=Kerstersia gyiorum TaxID=206506 RepID=UPI0020A0377A
MSAGRCFSIYGARVLLGGLLGGLAGSAWAQSAAVQNPAPAPLPALAVRALEAVEVLGTAEETLKQAPGVSIITAEDIAENPPSNDLADIIRRQPGVNLTGNSTSGQRGNSRQIDIRGMGPENTLILIDGRPVSSRTSVRYGWRGERDTRGDTNWVPVDAVERIEVLRGPAAARYGNGAAGGVVNIITKGIPETLQGSLTLYANQPEASKDGDTRRASFGLAGPISETLGFRLNGNIAKTDSDAWDINRGHASTRTGFHENTFPAGREGVRNRDAAGRLTWKPVQGHTIEFDAAFSRQGNIYTGDTQNTNNYMHGNPTLEDLTKLVEENLGAETNILYRETYALTHRGDYDFGTSHVYAQYEKTRNKRLKEGLAGGTEGLFSSGEFGQAVLRAYSLHGETSLPGHVLGRQQVLTLGMEWVRNELDDANSMTQGFMGGAQVPGAVSLGRASRTVANTFSLFAEDNIELTADTILTPGVRYDHHSVTGSNWSPSLNLSHLINDRFTVKAGIARAYKTPNLYQTNDNYLLYSNGNGCWGAGGPCYLQGNPGLKAETSVNKELGLEYQGDALQAGLTYFRNDYRDKIEAGMSPAGGTQGTSANIFRWENVPRAVVEGLEGNLGYTFTPAVSLSNNFTVMLTSKNKTTGEVLSVIPKYTLNSRLDWRVSDILGLNATLTWYGKQKPKKYDYHGEPLTGEATESLSPYALFGLGANYRVSRHLSVTAGVSNLFDKRLYRRGNAVTVNSPVGNLTGAGAATYNEPGRAYYLSVTSSF